MVWYSVQESTDNFHRNHLAAWVYLCVLSWQSYLKQVLNVDMLQVLVFEKPWAKLTSKKFPPKMLVPVILVRIKTSDEEFQHGGATNQSQDRYLRRVSKSLASQILAKMTHMLHFLELLPIWNSGLPLFYKEHLVVPVMWAIRHIKYLPDSFLRSGGLLLSWVLNQQYPSILSFERSSFIPLLKKHFSSF